MKEEKSLVSYLSKKILPIYYPQNKVLLSEVIKCDDFLTKPGINVFDKALYNFPFIKLWKDFVKESVIGLDDYTYFYPTSGSYEAIRETMAHLNRKTLVCFRDENQGYALIAKVLHMKIIYLDKNNWKNQIEDLDHRCVFFTSEPSFSDGNFFDDFHSLMKGLNKKKVDVYLDLSLIGATDKVKKIVLTNNIKGIFFSLDYSLGLEDYKLGGFLGKKEYPLLMNNIHNANLYSLKIGIEVLNEQESLLGNMPMLKEEQMKAIALIRKKFNISLKASDFFLLATVEDPGEYKNDLIKLNVNNEDDKIVVCLSKIIAESIGDLNVQ